jgi:hypothetical protein
MAWWRRFWLAVFVYLVLLRLHPLLGLLPVILILAWPVVVKCVRGTGKGIAALVRFPFRAMRAFLLYLWDGSIRECQFARVRWRAVYLLPVIGFALCVVGIGGLVGTTTDDVRRRVGDLVERRHEFLPSPLLADTTRFPVDVPLGETVATPYFDVTVTDATIDHDELRLGIQWLLRSQKLTERASFYKFSYLRNNWGRRYYPIRAEPLPLGTDARNSDHWRRLKPGVPYRTNVYFAKPSATGWRFALHVKDLWRNEWIISGVAFRRQAAAPSMFDEEENPGPQPADRERRAWALLLLAGAVVTLGGMGVNFVASRLQTRREEQVAVFEMGETQMTKKTSEDELDVMLRELRPYRDDVTLLRAKLMSMRDDQLGHLNERKLERALRRLQLRKQVRQSLLDDFRLLGEARKLQDAQARLNLVDQKERADMEADIAEAQRRRVAAQKDIEQMRQEQQAVAEDRFRTALDREFGNLKELLSAVETKRKEIAEEYEDDPETSALFLRALENVRLRKMREGGWA